jgi:hypothetical protein
MEAAHDERELERLPWHRPELRRLAVALDTRGEGGSGGDGELATQFDGVNPI